MDIRYANNMFTIKDEDIYFSLMENMYKTGHGIGLQINSAKDSKVLDQCNKLYDEVLKLDSMLKEIENGV